MKALFKAVFYKPIYNALVFFLALVPELHAATVIILFTIIIKLLLSPLSKKSIRTQLVMKRIEPELRALRERYKDNREKQTKELLAFYRKRGINPFSGFALILIQAPILIALYTVFYKAGISPVRQELLYSFVEPPAYVDTSLFGLDITSKSLILALIAGITQFLQVHLSMPMQSPGNDTQSQIAHMMQQQMKYVLPIITAFIAYQYSGVIALYLITGSIFSVLQEVVIRKRLRREMSASQTSYG